jgi:hypothetical protein
MPLQQQSYCWKVFSVWSVQSSYKEENWGNSKRQTRPLVREGARHQQTRNCQALIKNLVESPRWVLYSKTDWPTDCQS